MVKINARIRNDKYQNNKKCKITIKILNHKINLSSFIIINPNFLY